MDRDRSPGQDAHEGHGDVWRRLGRLGPVRPVAQVAQGEARAVHLELSGDALSIKVVSAALALARRGISLLEAKRGVEAVMEHGQADLRVPKVDDEQALLDDLHQAGIAATFLGFGAAPRR